MSEFRWDEPLSIPRGFAAPMAVAAAVARSQAAESAEDRERVPLAIEAARLHFAEENAERALELLDIAITRNPASEKLRIARFEIAFLSKLASRRDDPQHDVQDSFSRTIVM
jgi:hypothetical protein